MREFPSNTEILKIFKDGPGKTFRLPQLVVELELRTSQARQPKQALHELSRNHRIA